MTKHIPTYDPGKAILMVERGEATKEEVLKAFEQSMKTYSNCKDGSQHIAARAYNRVKKELEEMK